MSIDAQRIACWSSRAVHRKYSLSSWEYERTSNKDRSELYGPGGAGKAVEGGRGVFQVKDQGVFVLGLIHAFQLRILVQDILLCL